MTMILGVGDAMSATRAIFMAKLYILYIHV